MRSSVDYTHGLAAAFDDSRSGNRLSDPSAHATRALALRVVDTIERLIPGHALASELLAAIRARFGF